MNKHLTIIISFLSMLFVSCASTEEEFTDAQYETQVEHAMHEETNRMMDY